MGDDRFSVLYQLERTVGGSQLKLNNRGFTLVELIVVIAILAIVAVVATSFLTLVYSSRASEASDVFYSLMAEAKVATVSGRGEPSITLDYDQDKGDYTGRLKIDENEEQAEDLGEGSIEVYYLFESGPKQEVKADLEITFDRETGKLLLDPGDLTINVEGITGLSFEGGDRSYEIEIVQTTGYFGVGQS